MAVFEERDFAPAVQLIAHLAEALVKAGLSRDIALDLTARRPEVVETQLAHWPHCRGFRDGAAALRRAIEEDWPPPASHAPPADFAAWWAPQPEERRATWLAEAIAAQDRFTRQSLVGVRETRVLAALREVLLKISGWRPEPRR